MPGVPDVYIESNFAGHKAIPGKYTVTLMYNDKKVSATSEILANPLYATAAATYKEFDNTMAGMEKELSSMHRMVNMMNEKRLQLESLLKTWNDKNESLRKDADSLARKMKAWDEDMVQRKAKVYDDADNFSAKFTANYLFLINQTESEIPRVNQPSIDRMNELNAQWAVLKSRATGILEKDIPAMNKRFFEAGVGAIWER
jgi:thioester reductase-like protein